MDDRLDHYVFPVVTLSAETEPAALCTIFETLNRTGVKLSVFELLTARFWSQEIQLRDLWDQAKAEHPLIEQFEVDPYYVLMAIALAAHKTPSCKRSDVLNLTADQVINWWQPVITALARALAILQDDCWVLQPKWLPYSTMLAPMASLGQAAVPAGVLWVPNASKSSAGFGAPPTARPTKTPPTRRALVMSTSSPLAERRLPQAPERAQLQLQARGAAGCDTQAAIALPGHHLPGFGIGRSALDFHSRAVLNRQLLTSSGIVDHHLFPAHYLEEQGVEKRWRTAFSTAA